MHLQNVGHRERMSHLDRELDTYETEELSQSLKHWDWGVGPADKRTRLCILSVVLWH
jgi:hypothetical protein